MLVSRRIGFRRVAGSLGCSVVFSRAVSVAFFFTVRIRCFNFRGGWKRWRWVFFVFGFILVFVRFVRISFVAFVSFGLGSGWFRCLGYRKYFGFWG